MLMDKDGRAGKLNWPQLDWLIGQPADRLTSHEDNIAVRIPMGGLGVAEAKRILAAAIERHEALRTLVSDSPERVQRVSPVSQIASRLEAHTSVADVSRAGEAEKIIRATSFDLTRSWPVEFLLSTSGHDVVGITAVLDHFAADRWGADVLAEDIVTLSGRLGTGAPLTIDRPALQPLDLSDWELSAKGRAHLRRGLDFWHKQFAEIGGHLGKAFGAEEMPFTRPDNDASYGSISVSSNRLLDVARAASAKLEVSLPCVFLSALGISLCLANATPAVGIMMLFGNRYTLASRGSVSKMFMQAPIVVTRPGPVSLSEVTTRCMRQIFPAGRFSHVDRTAIDTIRAEELPNAQAPSVSGVHLNFKEEGIPPDSGATAPWTISPAPGQAILTEFRQGPTRRRGLALHLEVVQFANSVRLNLRSRNGTRWPAMSEALLQRIAHVVLLMATDPDTRSLPLTPPA
ncbi:condensation domain-containing protein [Nonomuraea sp. NPDC050153]|uniref:condensation domain-containing protein n=1 Tax=Nonomuraea sp. NPDC050153 TaxID=3364359 RepID=UPI00378A20E1